MTLKEDFSIKGRHLVSVQVVDAVEQEAGVEAGHSLMAHVWNRVATQFLGLCCVCFGFRLTEHETDFDVMSESRRASHINHQRTTKIFFHSQF